MEPKITTPEQFARDIEDIIWKYDINHFDAVLHYIEQNNIEVEAITGLLKGNSNLKANIRENVEDLHFLPKTTRLSF